MKKAAILIILSFMVSVLSSQNIYPVKIKSCKADRFCLDCGDIKASYEDKKFDEMIIRLNEKMNLQGMSGIVLFQVLIDSTGHGCVLSHTDKSKTFISKKIIKELKKFDGWIPAKTDNKALERVSISIIFSIEDGQITGKIKRINLAAFKDRFDHPQDPEIINKRYTYTNPNLSKYKITVWNSKNSNLPDNFNDDILIDKKNTIWMTLDEGLVKFENDSFIREEQDITDKGKYFAYYALGCDNQNVKWVYAKNNIYSYDNKKWTVYSKENIGFDGAYSIINNNKTGELFFCTDEGLFIRKDNKWIKIIELDTIEGITSKRIHYAQRDSKNRLWIGYSGGTLMIDTNGAVTVYNKIKSPFNGYSIFSMTGDSDGNLYFSLYNANRKGKKPEQIKEGIGVLDRDGNFKMLTIHNSGLPVGDVSKIIYDKYDNVLWIITNSAGLIRYDLKDGWEVYHNLNSKIPTSYVSDIATDNNGNIYLATRQGMVKIERK